MKFLAALFIAGGFIFQPLHVDPSAAQSKSQSFKVQKGGTLSVDVEPGNIELTPWDKDEVLVEVDGIEAEHMDRLKITQEGNTVKVRFKDRRYRGDEIDFRISLPKQFNSDLSTSVGKV